MQTIWVRLMVLAASGAAVVPLAGQDQPLSVRGVFSTGYYSSSTRGEITNAVDFVPVSARFEMTGYYKSADFLHFSAQPEVTLGPQASDAGFQGGNGIKFQATLFRKLKQYQSEGFVVAPAA